MKPTDAILNQGACAVLELAARRGSAAPKKAIANFTPRERALVPAALLESLRLGVARPECHAASLARKLVRRIAARLKVLKIVMPYITRKQAEGIDLSLLPYSHRPGSATVKARYAYSAEKLADREIRIFNHSRAHAKLLKNVINFVRGFAP